MKKVPDNDLQHIFKYTQNLMPELENKTIFITGGTGFFGKWLLDTLIYVNDRLSLKLDIYVLSRNPQSFLSNSPHYKHNFINFIKGDITNFEFPNVNLDYIIHAATEASVSLNLDQPFLMYDTIVEGTKCVLELGREKNVKAVLHTSSGAVYGVQPPEITHVDENYMGCPNIYADNAAYGEGKRVAEMMAAMYYSKYGVPSKIARCFAFVGPHLPLDTHFAVGNFINNLINNEDINVKDGLPYRSYLYASDLVIWLFTILINGKVCRPYNVGSDEDISISHLAAKVASFNNSKVNILEKKSTTLLPNRYVPSVKRAKNELGLKVSIELNTALKKTISFINNQLL
jgi:nucleoside-diphosphate-sugar epimerase